MPYRRKRMHKNNKELHKRFLTKRRTKDVDQVHEDLKPKHIAKHVNQPADYDLPGMGQFYCVHCARHFIDEFTLEAHRKSKVHKRRLKQLSETPYTQKEAEAAAGLGDYAKPSQVHVEDFSVVELRKDNPERNETESPLSDNIPTLDGDVSPNAIGPDTQAPVVHSNLVPE
eukprot:gene10638-2753_t